MSKYFFENFGKFQKEYQVFVFIICIFSIIHILQFMYFLYILYILYIFIFCIFYILLRAIQPQQVRRGMEELGDLLESAGCSVPRPAFEEMFEAAVDLYGDRKHRASLEA